MIGNPFGNRAMIADRRDFFGRKREIEQVLSRVLGGSKVQSAAMVGQRRIGKSSLFRRLVEQVAELDPRTHVAYYDLEASRKLTAQKFYATVLHRLQRASGDPPSGACEEDAYDRLVEFLERSEGSRRFVLLLDEFDTVTANPNFDADFFGSLRYLANNHDLGFVTSSYQDLTELCHAEEIRQSPFFNVFTVMDLKRMERDEVEEMVDTLSARGGGPLGGEERRAVLELGGRYPFFTQVAGAAAFELRRERAFSLPALEARCREEAWPHFRYFVDHLTEPERAALFALARGETPPAALVRRLRRRSLVDDEGAGAPAFFSPLFAEYLRERGVGALQAPRSSLHAGRLSQAGTASQRGVEAGEATAALGRRKEPATLAPEPTTGAQVAGRYTLESRLGAGSFGTVYRARDAVLGRMVALKFLRLDPAAERHDSEEREKRFRREAQALAGMKHPNLVTVHDLGECNGRLFIAMELVEGGTVSELIARRGRLGVSEAATITREAALGLAHAHAAGVVHRDVKPANLLLEPGGRVRVGDFGVLRYTGMGGGPVGAGGAGGEVLTWDGRAVGTPAYMAPEQLRPGSVDHRVDLYALGVVLFECVTGRRPFAADDLPGMVGRVLFDPPPDPRGHAPELPEDFVALLGRAMAKEPSSRFPSGNELARALAPFARLEG